LRIIGGSLRGRKLQSFKGQKVRPTSDRVKEALFNILGNGLCEGASVLDLYAGTGNLGIEALSRGAKRACFVEKERDSLKTLKENLQECGLMERAEIIPIDAVKAIHALEKKGESFDLVFLDPPYYRELADKTIEALGESTILREAVVIAEHSARDALKKNYGRLRLKDERRYGDTSLSFFIEEQ
jgi:16S rRNA (guanine(966)-N(2))-methyltransferase RsmD